jgi:hypothetical protein
MHTFLVRPGFWTADGSFYDSVMDQSFVESFVE